MKFFTKDLWDRINNSDKNIRASAENEWNKNCEEYRQQYICVKDYFPDSFISNYSRYNGFHDFPIISFAMYGENHAAVIQLSNGFFQCRLVFNEIEVLKLNFSSFESCVCGKPSWGYSELDRSPNGNLRISVLCDMENEILIEFGSLDFKAGNTGDG